MSKTVEPHPEVESPVVPGLRSWLRRFPQPGKSPKHIGWDPTFGRHRGADVRVALLDGALDGDLPVFGHSLILARDFTGMGDANDPTGHGTTHASLLVGQQGGGFEGLVPEAELLFGRVLWPGARGDRAGAVGRGVRWAAACGADVIVLPFGTSRRSEFVARAITAAAKAGCTIVAAAGNRGHGELSFPASLDEVVAVSGVDHVGEPLPECCALEHVDLAAPGSEVPAMGAQGPALLRGSAPATVIAAGVLALRRAASKDIGVGSFPGPLVSPPGHDRRQADAQPRETTPLPC